MSGINRDHQDVDIDLGGLFRAIWRRRARVALVTVSVAALALVGSSLLSKNYRSETRLLIESRQAEFSSGTQPSPQATDRAFDESAIASQVQVLRSIDLIKQVARQMKLYELPEFDPTASPSAVSDILVMLGLQKNPLDLPPEERVLKEFQQKLLVYQVEKSRVIAIQFTSKDQRLAAAIPNEMARVYLSLQSGAKLNSNSDASRWLEPEIANLREKVKAAEERVASYRASSDLFSSGDASGTLATKQLNDVATELARVRGERANAEAKAQGVRATLSSGRSVDTLNEVVGSVMIQRLKESESTIQTQIADLSTTLLDGHPRLKGLKAQLEGIRTQIRSETQKILASLENEAKVSQLREQQLTQQLNALKATSAKAGEDEVGLRALDREAAAQRQLLETYLARYREATSRQGDDAMPADARVISSAVEPTEANFPKVLPITIVAAAAAFLLSCVVIMLSELFSGRALRPVEAQTPLEGMERDLRAADGAAADATPLMNDPSTLPEELVGQDDAEDDSFTVEAVAEDFRARDVRVAIAISPGGDAGSTNTVRLARLMAGDDRKVVLIDLTATAVPTQMMAQSPQLPGITNLLVGSVPFAETIHADGQSNADIIPLGNADAGVAMRAVERLQMIIDALSNAYDTVLVECGPTNAAAIARVARARDTQIVISGDDTDAETLIDVIEAFAAAGYGVLSVMTGTRDRVLERRSQKAA